MIKYLFLLVFIAGCASTDRHVKMIEAKGQNWWFAAPLSGWKVESSDKEHFELTNVGADTHALFKQGEYMEIEDAVAWMSLQLIQGGAEKIQYNITYFRGHKLGYLLGTNGGTAAVWAWVWVEREHTYALVCGSKNSSVITESLCRDVASGIYFL